MFDIQDSSVLTAISVHHGERGAIGWYLAALDKSAEFSGRAQRKEYWFFQLVNLLILFVLGILEGILGIASESGMGIFSGVFILAMILPHLSVAVRRLHDIGCRGWVLLISLIPLVGIIIVLGLMMTEGEPGDNRYGLNPKTAKDPPLG